MNRVSVFLLWVITLSIGLLISNSYAAIYTGSLQYTPPTPPDSNDGLNVLVSGADWPTYTIDISWTVTNEDTTHPGYPWKYTYTFGHNGNQKGISHIVIETSNNFTQANLVGLTGASNPTYGLQTVGSGNPLMPENLYGIRFNPSTTSPFSMTWTFWSDRAPVWGDLYAKDGNNNYAYNHNNT